MWTRLRKPVLTLFILGHLIGLPLYLLPASQWRDALLAPFLPYINFCGLSQTWAVFAPSPPQCSAYMTALVTFQNGATTIWEFPRIEKMGLLDKVINERYRKWANDNVSDPENSILWPDAVRYVAGQFKDPSNQPVSVTLIRHQLYTPKPGSSAAPELLEDVVFTEQVARQEAQ